jgi:hypothetical protein
MNLSWVAWGQTAAVRWVPPVLYAVLAFVLAGGCAHSREGASASGSSQPTESPWALPTSTMRWNEYASELIGDLGVALGAGPVVILATKDDAPEDALGGIGVQGIPASSKKRVRPGHSPSMYAMALPMLLSGNTRCRNAQVDH